MKTHRFELGKFKIRDTVEDGNIYVDWPEIHKQAGLECIQWLKAQDPSQCQMVVEQGHKDNYNRVVAEIYTDKLATLYSLMWAK